MEIRNRYILLFEIALIILIGAVSQNESLKSCETTRNCTTENNGIIPSNRNDQPFNSLEFTPTAYGECIPVPPPRSAINDSDVPLQQRLADGVATLSEKRLEMGVDDQGIFLLGNTGAGKSTVTLLLAGNLSRIHASKTTSGDVVIFDEDDRIGPPSIVSKTLLPEYIVDKDSGVVFVDCPGFDDTRGTDLDIAAMYYLKNALDNANQAKFLFVIEFSAVKSGNDRTSFELLITHATTLIPNPKEKSAAIGLIVTKVPRRNDFDELRTREELLTGFNDFIKAYIDVKKGELDNAMYDEDKERIQRKIDLSEIFLSDLGADGLPTRISYFRSPQACGALDELPEMLETKEMLTDLYREMISYANVSPDDFKMTLKADTLLAITNNHVPATIDQIRNQTEIGIRKLQINFFEMFYTNMESNVDFHPMQIFSRAVERLDLHLKNMQADGSEFASHLFNLFTDLHMDSNDTLFITNEIQELENQLKFFEMVAGFNISSPQPSWLDSIKSMVTKFGEYLQYYDFCETVDLELRTHSKQLILGNMRGNGVEMKFETNDVIGFLSNNSVTSVPSKIVDLFNSYLDSNDRQYLADLVRPKLPNVTLECESINGNPNSHKLVVAGRYVRTSDIVDFAGNLPPSYPWPGQCSDKSNVAQITIFAEEILYIDDKLDFPCQQKHISIIAPEWEIIGALIEFMLGCYSVEEHKGPAPSGTSNGASGSHGANGKSGTDSATFLGIFSKSTNDNNLVINADGGPGGKGQNGGSGIGGSHTTKHASRGDFPNAMTCAWTSNCKPAWEVEWFHFRVSGVSGQAGGSGGKGGDGGRPGRAGTVELVTGEQSIAFIVSSKPGSPGEGGIGGSPGLGGNNGNDYDCWLGSSIAIDWWWYGCYSTGRGRARTGTQGSNGNNAPAIDDKVPTPAYPEQLIIQYNERFNKSFTNNLFLPLRA